MQSSTVISVTIVVLCFIHGNRASDEQSLATDEPTYEYLPEMGQCEGLQYDDSFSSFSMMFNLFDSYLVEPPEPSTYDVERTFVSNANGSQTEQNASMNHQHYIIHGWGGYPLEQWVSDMTDAILKREENVVYVIDWSCDAEYGYFYAAHSAIFIAEKIAEMIIGDYHEGNVDLDKLTLIGDDIGAHIAGIVGKKVYEKLNEQVGSIIATSPAGYHFKSDEEENKLTKSDAKCVAVIHTDNKLFGYRDLFGAMDFVVNKGYSQPGCNAFGFCSHLRARTYLTEAFNDVRYEIEPATKSFSGDEEKLILVAGGNCQSGNRVYNFETASQSPYL